MQRLVSTLLLLAGLWPSYVVAQTGGHPTPIAPSVPFTDVRIDASTPDWAVLMYSTEPNVMEIDRLYSQWRRSNPTIRTAHTRNLKHMMAYLVEHDAIAADGEVVLPSPEEEQRKEQQWLTKRDKLRSTQQRSAGAAGLWQSIGPTLVPETLGRTNAQANIYSLTQSASQPAIMYAGSEPGCVFKTIDAGLTWTSLCEDYVWGGPKELEVSPTNPDIVYLGTDHAIWKTSNGGSTWDIIYSNNDIHISTIIIHPTSTDILLAGGNEGLFRSTDAGTTWTNIFTARVYDLKFKTDDPSVVFALVNNGTDVVTDFYRSTNTGVSFAKVATGWDETDASSSNKGGRMTVSDVYGDVIYTFTGASYDYLSDGKDGVKIRKSSDGGLSWHLLYDSDTPSPISDINNGQGYYDWDIEMVDADTNTVMLGTQGRWLTTDGFATTNWAKVGGDLGHADLQEALFNGDDLWVASDGGIIKMASDFGSYTIMMDGINASEFWSFDQGWNRDAQVGTLYHNGTIGRTDTYATGQYRFFGGAEPEFSALKHPYPDQIISKGYGSVNGRSLPDAIADEETSFSYKLTPNANYAIYLTHQESDIEVMPYAYNTHLVGEGNQLWRSDDFGRSWTSIFEGRLDAKVTRIVIPKTNPEVIYFSEYHPAGYKLYKSVDGGSSFVEVTTLPAGPSSERDGVFIDGDDADEDVLFIAFRGGSNDNNKVWKTEDGGITWTNINSGSDLLDGERIRSMCSISGTDGGVYVATTHGVYYRNDTDPWMACIAGLPANLNIRHIKPYYKEAKIRIATMKRGVYSNDLVDVPTTVVVQPNVDLVEGRCVRDTFHFDDYSILQHAGASWSWSITPQPLYISDASARNPTVVFGSNGSYSATLTVTQNGQSYSKTLDRPIIIDSACEADTHAGHAYTMKEYGDHAIVNHPGLQLSQFTISYWVRPAAQQVGTAGMISAREGGSIAFMVNFSGSTMNPTLHYKNAGSNAWGVNPGMTLLAEQWNHIAVTSDILTGEVTLYVNGEAFTYPNVTALPIPLDQLYIGWQYASWDGRYLQGDMDELCIYDRVLSQSEVRTSMHLTKDPSQDASIVKYFQWNEATGTTAFDKVSTYHMILSSDFVVSAGPFAGGTAEEVTISGAGVYDLAAAGVKLYYGSAGTYPAAPVVATRLDTLPDFIPSNNSASAAYWVLHDFDLSSHGTALDSIELTGYGTIRPHEVSDPSELGLFTRGFGQYLDTWQPVAVPLHAYADPDHSISYDVSSTDVFGQLYIAKPKCATIMTVGDASDASPKSLRAAVAQVCPGDTIYFDAGLSGATIALTSGEIEVYDDVYLLGPGATQLIVDAGGSSRIFSNPYPGTSLGIEGLTMRNGAAPVDGGAFYNIGMMALLDVILSANLEGGTPKAFTNEGTIYLKPGTVEVRQ